MDEIDGVRRSAAAGAGIRKHGERILLATGRVMTSPPACLIAVVRRPPAVTTRADAPARVSASVISTVARRFPESRRGTICNMVTVAMRYSFICERCGA
jgi:hypothetical protein